MTKHRPVATKSILSQPTKKTSLINWLLKRAIWIILLPFVLILLLDIEVSQRIGIPEHRIVLAALLDPVYQTFILTLTITALLMRTFPQDAIHAFRRLMDQGVITGRKKESIDSFGEIYNSGRNSTIRYLLGLAFVCVGIAFSYYIVLDENLMRLLPGHQPADVSGFAVEFWLSNLLVGMGVILNVFLIGCWIFELIITAALIYRAPGYFEIQIQPAHPDQCAGFKVVGDLCLKMVYIVLIPTLFVSFWLYVSKHVALSPVLASLIPDYMLNLGFRTPAKVALGILILSGIAVFFWPMYTIHRRMVEEQLELQQELDKIATHIQQLDKSICQDPATMSADKRRKTLDEIDSLKELYLRMSNTPTWPFDRKVALKFASTQVVPFISLLSLGGPLGRLTEIIANLFQAE